MYRTAPEHAYNVDLDKEGKPVAIKATAKLQDKMKTILL